MRTPRTTGARPDGLVQLRLSFESHPPARAGGGSTREPLFVRHRRARRYVLRLAPDGRPRVTIPRGGSAREAEAFLAGHAEWVARQQRRHEARSQHAERAWADGDRIWYRGVLTTVGISDAEGSQAIALGSARLELRDAVTVRDAIERHLRALACAELPARLRELATAHGLAVSRVVVRDQRTRWGSCSPRGSVSLNWRLVQMPDDVRDYVLIHELMHLCEANHSRRFWRLVNAACPWHVEARRWLRRHGHDLHLAIAGSPAAHAGAVAPQGVEQQ